MNVSENLLKIVFSFTINFSEHITIYHGIWQLGDKTGKTLVKKHKKNSKTPEKMGIDQLELAKR